MALRELHVLLDTGRYLAALRQAGPMARDPGRPAVDRAEAALIASRAAFMLGMYREASEYASLARDQAPDAEQRVKALHYLGAALVYFDPQEAETVLLSALSMEETDYLRRSRPSILHALALAYEVRREPMAVTVYRQAAEGFLDQGKPGKAVKSMHNAAWLLALAGRYEEAQELVNASAELLPGLGSDLYAYHQAIDSYLQLKTGQTHEAILLAEELLQPGRQDVHPWPRTLAVLVATEVSLAEGLLDVAHGMVGVADQWVTQARCPKLCNLLSALRRQVLEKGGEVL